MIKVTYQFPNFPKSSELRKTFLSDFQKLLRMNSKAFTLYSKFLKQFLSYFGIEENDEYKNIKLS